MNRRGFISLLAGTAGATFVPWRGRIEPLIVLPPRMKLITRAPPYQYQWSWLSGGSGLVMFPVDGPSVVVEAEKLLPYDREGELVCLITDASGRVVPSAPVRVHIEQGRQSLIARV
jgi:hypothetical protein